MIERFWKWIKQTFWWPGEIRKLDSRITRIETHLDISTSSGRAVSAFEAFAGKEK